MTESMLVPAQLAYAYPRLAELADLRGDHAFAAQLRARARELLAVAAARLDRPLVPRAATRARSRSAPGRSSASRSRGRSSPARRAPARPACSSHNIRRFLTGDRRARAVIDGPAKIGSAISPAARDPGVTEPPTSGSAFDGASQYVGGVWFDVNGWLTWALAQLDGVVPGRRRATRGASTRATRSPRTPTPSRDHWDGTISIDDACNAFYAHAPATAAASRSTTTTRARSPSSRPGW